MSKCNLILLFVALCAAGMLLGACRNTSVDYLIQEAEVINSNLSVPVAEYRNVAWLEDETLAFVYRTPDFGDRLGDFRIAIYSLTEQNWKDMSLPPDPENCSPAAGLLNNLQRLPNGNLGFTYDCSSDNGISGILYEWNRIDGTVKVLFIYPIPFAPGEFSFAPDMSQSIQQSGHRPSLANELYLLSQQEGMTRLMANFKRASSPAWAANDKIAFIGTESLSSQPQGPHTMAEVEDLLLDPWDLYLMSEDGSDLRIIFPKIGQLYQMRWSKNNQELFFAGSRPNAMDGGVWRLDLETNEIARLWPYNTFFDLSPDQTKMVIIARETTDGAERTYPLVVALPQQ